MTRREPLGLLGALPVLGLSFPFARTRTATVALKWDWEPDGAEPIDYFEVFVTKGDEVDAVVTRVAGHLRACEVSLPVDGTLVHTARVRATNSHGSSVFSAPVILNS